MRAGRENHVVEAKFEDVARREVAVEIDLDVRHLANPPDAPVAHACPGGQSR